MLSCKNINITSLSSPKHHDLKAPNALAFHVSLMCVFFYSLQGKKNLQFPKQALKTKDYPANYILSETTGSHGRTQKVTYSATKQAITITISSTDEEGDNGDNHDD